MKMGDENINYCLQQLAGFDPEDIEGDDFDIAVNDDHFAQMSIVRLSELACESHANLMERVKELEECLSDFDAYQSTNFDYKGSPFQERVHKLLEKE